MNEINIIDFKFNLCEGTFSLILNIWILLIGIALFFLIRFLIKRYIKSNNVHNEVVSIKLKYKIGGAEVEYAINRNYQNIEIAHRIYIEMITRKAALPIENNDVIVEVYNSWYSLFQITRDELKKLTGVMLLENNESKDLIKLLTDILNEGLRPHLTEYQAKFRKWYNEALELEENKRKTPQDIQAQYDKYQELFDSMKYVNSLLSDYKDKLSDIINGKKKNGA
ncbi:hypothetical protein BIU88_10380 [Chlorobaculum limnaeum]|uniref:Uncharacterized protein n=1 Tax=Chlorobaculum limnaeum TaxID=274537 RepID=A0A1D8D2N6_CHLLM|nr:hypothetical protein [Chlorobaculum limnaeum]AOS84503.1 hypothetical protein BIU88_10380 [Chlorobaculum limnaeum]